MAHFDDLIEGLLNGSLTKEQQQELNVLLEDPNYANQLKTKLETELISGRFTPQETSNFEAQILQNIQAGVTQKITPVKKLNWYKYAAAAAVLFAIVTTYFIIPSLTPKEAKPST